MMKLNEAIPRGRIEHVREAIARGADLNPPTAQDGMTPLLHAAAGHAAVVRELLAAGAGSNRADTPNACTSRGLGVLPTGSSLWGYPCFDIRVGLWAGELSPVAWE
jgi:ankyrin repeat protein